MRITQLKLRNFKRFTDLTVDLTSCATPPKLVLLIGSNGSGKSSVFDAFEAIISNSKDRTSLIGGRHKKLYNYHEKGESSRFDIDIETLEHGILALHYPETSRAYNPFIFYGRSSLRQVTGLTRKYLGEKTISFEADTDRPRLFSERDERFENDLEDVVRYIYEKSFGGNLQQSISSIAKPFIDKINKAFLNIFGNNYDTSLSLYTLIPPLGGTIGDIRFKKGVSEIHYDLLSAGEKEIFNIFINLVSRQHLYTDTVFFFDELDLHLNTKIQENLVKELTENWIPDNCQLWLASHSLGFMQYANKSPEAAIIDFDDYNFDKPHVLIPEPKNNVDVFEIAVSRDFLSEVFKNKTVLFTEGSDTPFYNNLGLKNTVCIKAKDKKDAFFNTFSTSCSCLIDRDFLTDEERVHIHKIYPNVFLLNYYSFENYLYHPDNLAEYYTLTSKPFDRQSYVDAITKAKNHTETREDLIASIRGTRDGYPFFKTAGLEKDLIEFKENSDALKTLIRSDDFETFYKALPMKDYCTQIPERQNLSKDKLCQTKWFKNAIQKILHSK